MDFSLNREQEMLRESVRKSLQSHGGIDIARSSASGERVLCEQVYRELAKLGVTSVTVPEDYGGAGLSVLDLVPVLEETGRLLLPGALRETVAFATPLINRYGTEAQKEELLPQIADGHLTFALAFAEPGGDGYQPGSVQGTATRSDGDRLCGADGALTLNAVKTVVHGGTDATAFLVPLRTPDRPGGISWFWVERDVPGVVVEPLKTFDETLGLAKLTLDRVEVGVHHLIGEWGQGLQMYEECVPVLHAAVLAEMVGAMEQVLSSVTEYAKTRVQFGQPIGRFQAVKHRIVDRRLELETAKSLTYYANWAVSTDAPDAKAAVYSARAYTTEAFIRAASDNIQLHGGIGFTWEMDCHLYLKRARALENYLGTVQDFEEQTALALGW